MKTVIKFAFLLLVLANQGYAQKIDFKAVKSDTSCRFRGLSVVDDSVAWVSGKGILGRTTDGGNQWQFSAVKGYEQQDFRTLYAFNGKEAVIANAGSPAFVLRTFDGGNSWSVLYTNKDTSAFIDGVDFWNDKEGVIYGDPIGSRMLLLRTTDGGKTWAEFPEMSRPSMAAGEASFAASGTGIRCYGRNKLMISTGGTVSRLFVSEDKGKSWDVLAPPVIQGKSTMGIFSFAFGDDMNGVIVGGDYRNDTLKNKHVLYTKNAGHIWSAPKAGTGGYRECVEYITKDLLLACGPGGMDVSYDGGASWVPIEGQAQFSVVRKARKGSLVIAAGNKKISIVSLTR